MDDEFFKKRELKAELVIDFVDEPESCRDKAGRAARLLGIIQILEPDEGPGKRTGELCIDKDIGLINLEVKIAVTSEDPDQRDR